MNKLFHFFLPIIAITILGVAVITGKTSDTGSKAVFTVAIDREYAPYEFVDVDGTIKGFTPDLLRGIGELVGVSFRLEAMNWPDAVARLADGSIDLVNMIRTQQRIGQYEFSEPHSFIKQAIFRYTLAREITDLESLAGYRVALQQNDISLEMLADRTDFKRYVVQGKAEGFLILNAGKVDAFLAADQTGLRLIREYDLSKVEPVTVGLFPQDFCFAARLGNKNLINLLNKGLYQLKESGRYDEIVDTWLALEIAENSRLTHHWPKMVGLAAALVLLLAGFAVWNMLLQRIVAQRTKALCESSNSLNVAQRIARLGSWDWDINSDTLWWSEETFSIFGIDPEKFGADFNTFIDAVHPNDRDQVRRSVEHAISEGVKEWCIDYRIILPDGELRFVHEEAKSVFAPNGKVVKRIGTVQDITDRKRSDEEVRQHLVQQKSLLDMYQKMAAASIREIILFVVDRCVNLTGSAIGFVGLISNDEKHMETYVWSETVMKNCPLDKPLLFQIDTAGLWAEPIRQQRMVIVNDFSMPNPCIKGCPEGHLKLERFMGVPVVDQGRVVAVAGVANREEGYVESDHTKVSLLLEGAWDLIKRKKAEGEMWRLNRELQAISNCNQVLLKAEDEQELLNDICTIICDEAGYRLAWVGYVQDDEDKSIKPVAWAGFEADYVAKARLSWAEDQENGQGPAGIAIRSGKPIHVEDFAADSRMTLWRESAMARGYRSGIALPLKDDKAAVFGVLLIYSTEPHAVTAQEFNLMEGLAGDLAFGITVLRTRTRRNEVEAALQENQRLLLEAQHMAHIGNWWHDMITGDIHWSDECFRIIGREPQEITLEIVSRWIHPEDLPILLKAMEESAAGKIEHEHDFRVFLPNGEVRWLHNHWLRVNDQDGKEIKRVGTHQDITEQKIAEEKLRKLNTELDQRVKDRTAELLAKNEELERMNQVFVGRELRMVELKKKIKELEREGPP